MSSKSKYQPQPTEEELIAEFKAEQRAKRFSTLKLVGVIILCVLLVIAFCFPAVGLLF